MMEKSGYGDLFDLIIYDLEDGDNVDKFSAEHLTRLSMNEDYIRVSSTQAGDHSYPVGRYGFYFSAR